MVHRRLAELLAFVSMITLFMGCTRAISPEMRQQVSPDASFPMVLQNPEAYVGRTLILGGVIINSLNRPDGTEIVVLETPLDYQEFPRDEEHSRGRFIARTAAYLDPEVYKKGRKITLAGAVIGKETRPLGEIEYTYPVLQIKELHLWKEVVRYYPYPTPYWHWYGPYYWWPYYPQYPYWW